MKTYQEQLDEYLLKIKNIKEEALKNGCIIDGDRIIDVKDKLFVMESYFKGETQHESYGYFKTTRQFRILDENTLKRIKSIRNSSLEMQKLKFIDFWEDNVDDDNLAYGAEVIDFFR